MFLNTTREETFTGCTQYTASDTIGLRRNKPPCEPPHTACLWCQVSVPGEGVARALPPVCCGDSLLCLYNVAGPRHYHRRLRRPHLTGNNYFTPSTRYLTTITITYNNNTLYIPNIVYFIHFMNTSMIQGYVNT